MTNLKLRLPIAILSLSAAAFGGIALKESYTEKAVIPIPGDRPTIGFGSTFNEQGKPVLITDKITPPQAVIRSLAHIAKDETELKKCVTKPITQKEYDILVDFAYQYGTNTVCKSSIVQNINIEQYKKSCDSYLLYRFAAGKDCSIAANRCRGVWLRSQGRHEKCTAQL